MQKPEKLVEPFLHMIWVGFLLATVENFFLFLGFSCLEPGAVLEAQKKGAIRVLALWSME